MNGSPKRLRGQEVHMPLPLNPRHLDREPHRMEDFEDLRRRIEKASHRGVALLLR